MWPNIQIEQSSIVTPTDLRIPAELQVCSHNGVLIRDGYIEVLGKRTFKVESCSLETGVAGDYMHEFSLCYFDFLNLHRHNLSQAKIENIVRELQGSHHFFHPYVACKRIQNLIVFLSIEPKKNDDLRAILARRISIDYAHLKKNIEYHIDANHLLSNFAALAMAASVLGDQSENRRIEKYWAEFERQFLDTLHFERSVSYTKQLIHEALIVWQVTKARPGKENQERISQAICFMKAVSKIGLKLNFVDNIEEQSFELGELEDLFSLITEKSGNDLEIGAATLTSGYVIAANSNYSYSLDVGVPSPAFQPGHAHDSTGGMEIAIDGHEIFGCGGISTYEDTQVRSNERSRFSYSKVTSFGVIQDVWKSFRVAKRRTPSVSITNTDVTMHVIRKGSEWVRKVELNAEFLCIHDQTLNSGLTARYILYPNCELKHIGAKTFELARGENEYIFIAECDECQIGFEAFGDHYGVQVERMVLVLNSVSGICQLQIRKVKK